jgi:SWIM zinc finger
MPINNAYGPKVEKWKCTCPAFAVSRFLICKHLIQCVQHVPPIFFLKTDCFCEPPFWRPKSLQPLEEYCIKSTAGVAEPVSGSHDENFDLGSEGD